MVPDTDTASDKTRTEIDAPPLSSDIPDSGAAALPSQEPAPAPGGPPLQAMPEPHVPELSQPATPARFYLVQIGAFRNETNARRMVAKLRDKGYKPFIRTVQGRQNDVLHRVFLDRAQDKARAQAAAKAFEEAEKMDALVMLTNSRPTRRDEPGSP